MCHTDLIFRTDMAEQALSNLENLIQTETENIKCSLGRSKSHVFYHNIRGKIRKNVQAPSLEVLKAMLDGALSNPV